MDELSDMALPAFLPDFVQAEHGADSSMADTAASPAGQARSAEEQDPASAAPQDPWASRLQAHESQQREQWQEQVSRWRQQAEQDPQLGGANLQANVARAQLALNRFDTDKSIGRLLEQSGYGNHPAILRFFNRMADALMEDSPALGQGATGMAPLEERMYAGWSSNA